MDDSIVALKAIEAGSLRAAGEVEAVGPEALGSAPQARNDDFSNEFRKG